MIRFMEMFSKEYGRNKVLGETCLQAVTHASFTSSWKTFPMVRVACVVANLICPAEKVKDGICRLLLPTDVASVSSKARILDAMAAEAQLNEAWTLLLQHVPFFANPAQGWHYC